MRYLFLLIFLIFDLISVTYLLKGRSLANGVVTCANPIARVVEFNHPTYRFATPICQGYFIHLKDFLCLAPWAFGDRVMSS
jgi:hypothetical protein